MASSDNPFPASQSPLGLARARSRESREILLATRGPQDFSAFSASSPPKPRVLGGSFSRVAGRQSEVPRCLGVSRSPKNTEPTQQSGGAGAAEGDTTVSAPIAPQRARNSWPGCTRASAAGSMPVRTSRRTATADKKSGRCGAAGISSPGRRCCRRASQILRA